MQAGTLLHNHASRRVLAKNGFTEIGVAPRYINIAGRWQDHVLHQRLVDDPNPDRSPAGRPAGPAAPVLDSAAVSLDVRYLGLGGDLVDYRDGWDLQHRIHAEVVSGAAPDTLLLLEHASVYTAGKRTEPHERPLDGTPVVDVDRGGKITWHGPGQLVGYPLVRLPEAFGVVDYVRRLEQALIDALAELGLDHRTRTGAFRGVAGRPTPRPAAPSARSPRSASAWPAG